MSSALVAVAGATGNCGRAVVVAAKQRGLRVRALVRDAARLEGARAACDEVRIVQATDREALRGALDGASLLVSALGRTHQKDRAPRRAVDVEANLNLFEEAKRAGVGRVAFVSVFGARRDHPAAMVRMKTEAEAGLRASDVPSVIIRPTGFFSDMWEVFQMARRGTVWCLGSADYRINPIAPEDLGAFIVDALLDDAKVGQVLEVGGPDVLSIREIATTCGRILERGVRVRTVPLWLAKAGVLGVRPLGRRRWELAEFFVSIFDEIARRGGEVSAPQTGALRLEDYFRARYLASGK